MCPYNFYNENDNYFPYLYCSIDGKRCLYSKKCNKEQRYIPLDNHYFSRLLLQVIQELFYLDI